MFSQLAVFVVGQQTGASYQGQSFCPIPLTTPWLFPLPLRQALHSRPRSRMESRSF